MRKIIQIAVSAVENNRATQCNYMVVALCDDGTVWEKMDTRSDWYQCPPIPKDDAQNNP